MNYIRTRKVLTQRSFAYLFDTILKCVHTRTQVGESTIVVIRRNHLFTDLR